MGLTKGNRFDDSCRALSSPKVISSGCRLSAVPGPFVSATNKVQGQSMTQSILIVDDSRTMREVLKVYLMGRKFEFIEADGAERALHLLRLLPVALVIVDLKMPKMDGFEFLRRLRGNGESAGKRIPVVVVTADKNEESRQRAMVAGADAFLHKPLDSDRVAEVVNRLLLPE
jgi:two-component system, chemotaxis family, chemotaxis protein CheY